MAATSTPSSKRCSSRVRSWRARPMSPASCCRVRRQGGDAIKQWVRDQAWGHHCSCSCKIGADGDAMVLDSNFKVRKTRNLRVVDASVFPHIPGTFIVLPIYMISEKAAAVIIAEARAGQGPSGADVPPSLTPATNSTTTKGGIF